MNFGMLQLDVCRLVMNKIVPPTVVVYCYGADSRLAASQWETSLQSNAVSHWLDANLESALLQLGVASADMAVSYYREGNSYKIPIHHPNSCHTICIVPVGVSMHVKCSFGIPTKKDIYLETWGILVLIQFTKLFTSQLGSFWKFHLNDRSNYRFWMNFTLYNFISSTQKILLTSLGK